MDFTPENYNPQDAYNLPGIEWIEDQLKLGQIHSKNGWDPMVTPREGIPFTTRGGRTDGMVNNIIATPAQPNTSTTRVGGSSFQASSSSSKHVVAPQQNPAAPKQKRMKICLEDTPPPAAPKRKKQKLIMTP